MSKSKVKMPKELNMKCHAVIHSATTGASAAGATPIPISDAIVISGVQIAMICGLGKVFGFTLSESTAKSIAKVMLTQSAGRAIFSNVLKMIPGAGTLVGAFVGAATAGALTEALGWLVADDFYRISIGETPENLVESIGELAPIFQGLRAAK